MLPFSLSFRRLVLKNIPQLKVSALERPESLIAMRQHGGAPPALTRRRCN